MSCRSIAGISGLLFFASSIIGLKMAKRYNVLPSTDACRQLSQPTLLSETTTFGCLGGALWDTKSWLDNA